MWHPKQIGRTDDLRDGEEYALVWRWWISWCNGLLGVTEATFVGTMPNSDIASALRFMDIRGALDPDRYYLTLHIHRIVEYGLWMDHTLRAAPGFASSGSPESLLGLTDDLRMVVPLREWEADPQPREGRPSHIVHASGAPATWADEEARLRRKRDAAMRRACGFD